MSSPKSDGSGCNEQSGWVSVVATRQEIPMLLSITTTHQPATDLGFLLHKHPGRFQTFELSFGKAHVFYPHASAERCTACLSLDVDPVGIVRRKSSQGGECVFGVLALESEPEDPRL
jgi:hypothetical protein